MQGQPIQSRPISEILMSPMEPRYKKYVYQYLTSLGCRVTPDGPGHKIELPAGTVEETYRGQSTSWTHKTLIRFPTGETLTKYEAVVISDMRFTTTTLAFPVEILEPAERK